MTFQEFVTACERGFDSGILRLENGGRLTERDYAVYFCICKLREETIVYGKKCEFTFEEIFDGVFKYCGEDVANRVFGEEKQ